VHLREFVWFVGVMSTTHVSNYLSDLGNSDDGVSQVLGDSRLILLVRIRGFSLLVHRNKGIRSDAIDRVTSALRKLRNA
jgi:hypothetical protein